MINSPPLVSILINNYNNADYIEACIVSALNQGYPHVEVIVYDDGSTDGSKEIINKFEGKVIIISEENYGQGANFNQANAVWKAFEKSKGEIICLLDGDDVFFPNKATRVVEAFSKNENLLLVQNVYEEMDKFGNHSGKIRPFFLFDPQKHHQEKQSTYMLRTHSLFDLFLQTSALSFKRSFLEKKLPIKKDRFDRVWLDNRLTRQVSFMGEVHTIFEPLTYYRLHDSNDSSRLQDKEEFKICRQQVYDCFNEFVTKNGYDPISFKNYERKQYFLKSFWLKRKKKYFS